jgi:hypothetical protein
VIPTPDKVIYNAIRLPAAEFSQRATEETGIPEFTLCDGFVMAAFRSPDYVLE